MSFRQIVRPNLNTRDGVGWCLRFTQTAYGAPAAYPSAKSAWDGQKGRHPGELPPRGVSVPIWFDHWGSYGFPATYGNWGHVAVWLGDGRILSSPMNTSQGGQVIFNSIAELQRAIGGNPTYLGYSEYLNGKQIVVYNPTPKPTPTPTPGLPAELGEEMFIANIKGSFFLIVPNGKDKPTAVVLGADSGAVNSGIPVIAFTWETSIAALKRAVTGI